MSQAWVDVQFACAIAIMIRLALGVLAWLYDRRSNRG